MDIVLDAFTSTTCKVVLTRGLFPKKERRAGSLLQYETLYGTDVIGIEVHYERGSR